jgi:hypothetical protein
VWNKLKAFSAIAIVITSSACAPASWFGNPEDTKIAQAPGYRRMNGACSNMDLSRSELDLVTARKLVDCLNSGGDLGSVAALVKSMSDKELTPFVRALNRSLLRNPKNLFKLESTFNDLNEGNKLKDALSGLGELMSNDELLLRSLKIFRKAYFVEKGADESLADFDRRPKLRPELLLAARAFSTQLTEDKVSDALDLGLLVTRAQAFSSFWENLTGSPAAREGLSPEVARSLLAYLKTGSTLGRTLIQHFINGNAFGFTDQVVPEDVEGLRSAVAGWSTALDINLAEKSRYILATRELFEALDAPISCMKGARSMKHAALDIFRDLSQRPSGGASSFIQRERLIELFLAKPLCTYPDALYSHYGQMMEMASTPAIEPMGDVLGALYRVGQGDNRPMAQFAINLLTDPGFPLLLPALTELSSRGTYADLFLLATVARLDAPKDRAKLIELLTFLTDPIEGAARNQSVYDVLLNGFVSIEDGELTDWFKSFRATKSGLGSAFQAIRTAYYVNNVHPLIDLLRETLTDAPEDPELLETAISLTDRPEFAASIGEVSRMALDGRLRDLMGTTLSMFHGFAERGGHVEIARLSTAPALRFSTRHDLKGSDLPPAPMPKGDFAACRAVDLTRPWNAAGPLTDGQLARIAACADGDGQFREVREALDFLSSAKTDDNHPQRTIYSLVVEAYNSIKVNTRESKILADWSLGAVQDGRVQRVLRALPMFVKGELVDPLVALADPIIADIKARSGLSRLTEYGASVLRRADIQTVLAYVDDLVQIKPATPAPHLPSAAEDAARFGRERILRWISNKECASLPAADAPGDALAKAKDARYEAIIDEYRNSVVGYAPRENGQLPRDWTLPGLKAELDPIFKKLGDVENNGPLVHALLKFAARFNDPAQYPKGYLEKWLRDRAGKKTLISYIYPGEQKPQVRLVNGLDRLGLVLLNADLYAEALSMNFAMVFLGKIAQAWGDVPLEQRPAEIRAPLADDTHGPCGDKDAPCQTMAQAVAEIKDIASTFTQLITGFPPMQACAQTLDPNDHDEIPEPTSPVVLDPVPAPGSEAANLQVSMYNVYETIGVLEEGVQDGGVKVLRDLFFDLYYTGPEVNRDPNAGIKNNLSVIMRLVKSGLLRQVGSLLDDVDPADAAKNAEVSAFFRALIDGASTPATEPLFNALFIEDKEQDLIWKVMGEILALKDPKDVELASSIGFRLLSAIDSLGHSREASGVNPLLGPTMAALAPIASQYRAYLGRHADLVGDALTWQGLADALEGVSARKNAAKPKLLDLVLDALSDPSRGMDGMAILASLDATETSQQNWESVKTRFRAVRATPEYKDLHLGDVGDDFLKLLEGRSSNAGLAPLPENERKLTRKLLNQLADLIEKDQGRLGDQLLVMSRKNPRETTALIESLAGLIRDGQVQRFLDLIQSSLSR